MTHYYLYWTDDFIQPGPGGRWWWVLWNLPPLSWNFIRRWIRADILKYWGRLISHIEVKSNIWILNYVTCQMRHRRESFIANVTLYTPTPGLYWRDKHSLPNHVFFISHYSYHIIAILFLLIRIDRIRAHERFQTENKYLNIHKHISFSLLYYVKIVIVNTYFEILVWGIYRVDQNKVILVDVDMAITPLKSTRKGKSWCVLENSEVMIKPFKIGRERLRKNNLKLATPL